jgi:hypothetical protein
LFRAILLLRQALYIFYSFELTPTLIKAGDMTVQMPLCILAAHSITFQTLLECSPMITDLNSEGSLGVIDLSSQITADQLSSLRDFLFHW